MVCMTHRGRGMDSNFRFRGRHKLPYLSSGVLSALAPGGGYQSSWGTLLLVFRGMNRDAVPGMSINGRQTSV